ncbi:MAG: hypothetical protein Fur0010_16010 [Bdellovibrio sp.]
MDKQQDTPATKRKLSLDEIMFFTLLFTVIIGLPAASVILLIRIV